jgi:hypothetical protein
MDEILDILCSACAGIGEAIIITEIPPAAVVAARAKGRILTSGFAGHRFVDRVNLRTYIQVEVGIFYGTARRRRNTYTRPPTRELIALFTMK